MTEHLSSGLSLEITWAYKSYFHSPDETNWLIVATGVADCYYNVVDLPAGGAFRFRVACVNKAGQGPYSNLSEVVAFDPVSGMHYLYEILFQIRPSIVH